MSQIQMVAANASSWHIVEKIAVDSGISHMKGKVNMEGIRKVTYHCHSLGLNIWCLAPKKLLRGKGGGRVWKGRRG